ncbi:MAG: SctK family type III secretion system sorting platform protein [Janthinobacterium lividum]
MTGIAAGTDAAQLRALIAHHPDLFRLMYAFNYAPADYLHPARQQQFLPLPLNQRIWETARARRPLSKLILQQIGLAERPCFDPQQRTWPLALLDRMRMLRLARHVGAVLLAPQARRCVSREEVLAWKERLTPSAYQFVMSSASLLPQVKADAAIDENMSVEQLGFAWIASSLDDAPDELLLRVRLKFPPLHTTLPLSRTRAAHVVHAVFSTLESKWISSCAAMRP